ncbi:hypothetical protein QQ336_10265, partial [Enterococcus faecium]|nr:hypothetical protein [Enterococcus faecium]
DQSINQCKITKNLSQNVVHSDSDLILHNSSVLIDKEPKNSHISLKNIPFRSIKQHFLIFEKMLLVICSMKHQ